MIYKQRPDATACAEYDLWNKTMRRYVRRGSQGIALIDLTGDRPKLRYVFDVSDTGERENSRPVNLWSMREEYVPAVQAALERAYGVEAGAGLDEQIEAITSRLAAEYWEENRDSILGIVDDSFLYGYDEFNVEVSFRRAAETSIKYMLYSRCVEDPESYFEPEDFMDVFDFNTQAASNVLGTAVSEVSSQVFREIERAIRTYERAIETQKPNYEITVSILDAPTLSDRIREAGISVAQFAHENSNVTFSFSEDDRDAVEKMAADLRPGVEPTSVQAASKSEVEITTTAETIYRGDKNGLPFDVVIEKLYFGEPEHEQPEQPQKPAARNFRITDDHLGEGGPKAKFRANMDAINLLHELEFDGRDATPEEQEILSRYVGWGGLADAFDEKKDSWASEFKELYAALSPEEYAAARASTLNAHYTSPTVIRAIYDAVEQMGFQKGNILEPSMGVGNFFGLLPDKMAGSKLYGVELDSITGRIAQKLYPEADIKVAGFQTTDRRDFYDLCVGNVPFGDYKVNDKPYNKLGFSIHNYFFAKAIDQVRPGGVVALVTSRYTMDAKSPDARKYIAQRVELLGAIRLPNNAFKANAGTEVVSDILFLQKRDRPIDIEPDWVHLRQTPDGLAINSYFTDHPEMVLGELTTESTQYGREECTVRPIPGADLSKLLQNKGFEADIQTVEAHPLPDEGFVGMDIGGKHYAEKADAGDAILALCKEIKSTEGIPIGSYRGFQMELSYDTFEKQFQITMKGEMSHRVSLGTDARGNLTRLDNALAGITARLERGQEQLENLRNQQTAAQVELEKPFPQEAELAEKSARLV